MRKIIMLKAEKPKLTQEEIKAKVAEIINLFDAYLDEYPIKSAKSKHGVMGPVAKVLDRAQAGQWDIEPLTGYALRMHEMNPRLKGYISQTAVQNLHAGTEALIRLCQEVPVTALATVIEQIDYGLYFQRRTKGVAWLETQGRALTIYLQTRYRNDEGAFRKAWALGGREKITLQNVHFFGASSKRYKDGNDTLKADMDAFYAQTLEPEAIVEEEDN